MMPSYMDEKRSAQIAFWGLGQMLRGAGYAAAVLVTIGVLLWGIWLVGQLLPDESKQAPSPYFGTLEPLAPAARATA